MALRSCRVKFVDGSLTELLGYDGVSKTRASSVEVER